MKPTILLTHPLPPDWIASLEGQVTLIIGQEEAPGWRDNLLQALPQAEGILSLLTARVDEAILEKASHLRIVSNVAVGVDNIDVKACTRRGIPVGNTPGAMTDATADLAMSLLLAAARKLPESSRDAREGRWETWSPTGWLGADLRGAALGIIGLGKIGPAVAERARGFGLRVRYWQPRQNVENEATGAEYVPFDELLSSSDFVTLHCPLNESTRGLIGESALRKMKPSAILVNAARGPVVDTAALTRAIRKLDRLRRARCDRPRTPAAESFAVCDAKLLHRAAHWLGHAWDAQTHGRDGLRKSAGGFARRAFAELRQPRSLRALIFQPANTLVLRHQRDEFFLVARLADGAPCAGDGIVCDLEMILCHAQAAILEDFSQVFDATRDGLTSGSRAMENKVNKVEPSVIKMIVRNPAALYCTSRSRPIAPPTRTAMPSLMISGVKNSIMRFLPKN